MRHKIYVTRAVRDLGFPDARRYVRAAVSAALRAEGVDAPCLVSVLLTDEEGIRALNMEFRGVDAPTDVLSFPLNELRPGEFDASACESVPETGLVLLGDMAVSLPRVASQAEEYGHSWERELSYLTVHSVLHLLGYDHTDEGECKRLMREREKTIMERMEI